MPTTMGAEIRKSLDEIVSLIKQGRTADAAELVARTISMLDSIPIKNDAAVVSAVTDRYTTLKLYLEVAVRDLEAGETDDALISLSVALTTWTRRQSSSEQGPA
jgi:hypothetical protein